VPVAAPAVRVNPPLPGAQTGAVNNPRPTLHVVFVCSGNICRSPIAEKVLVQELAAAGLADGVRVSSAGTGGWHVGSPADERAAAALRAEGYPDLHEARQVDAEDLAADLIVALDRSHQRMLRSMVPEPDRVRLLRSFDPAAPPDAEVPDPYYGEASGFADVLTMIKAAAPGLVDWVRAQR
jgi:protein-tyrosine phosphatase